MGVLSAVSCQLSVPWSNIVALVSECEWSVFAKMSKRDSNVQTLNGNIYFLVFCSFLVNPIKWRLKIGLNWFEVKFYF